MKAGYRVLVKKGRVDRILRDDTSICFMFAKDVIFNLKDIGRV